MWHLGVWFTGGLGTTGLMLGRDDLKGLFQAKQFHVYLWKVSLVALCPKICVGFLLPFVTRHILCNGDDEMF